jgi:dipeptidyl aminopeptidase/acylaminoacyl peptidase
VLFTTCRSDSCLQVETWALRFGNDTARLLVADAARIWYVPTGHVVYVRTDGNVFAASFNPGSLAITGPAVPVLEGIQVAAGRVPDFDISRSGTVLMVSGTGGSLEASTEAVWVTRAGIATSIDSTWRFATSNNRGWALSPDNKRLAIALIRDRNEDIWIKELDNGPLTRLTTDSAPDQRPRWMPDGINVSYISLRAGRRGAWMRKFDATQPERLLRADTVPVFETAWSKDGRWLVMRTGVAGRRDVMAMRVGVDSAPTTLLASDFDERAVMLSPDGRWLLYESNEAGRDEVFVRPFPDISAAKYPVSVDGGHVPYWAHNGREIFYVDLENNVVVAQIRADAGVQVTSRQRLFSLNGYITSTNYTFYDVSADDKRFVLMRPAGAGVSGTGRLVLIEN